MSNFATERGDKPQHLTVEFVPYEFNGNDPRYKALVEQRRQAGIECFSTYRMPSDKSFKPGPQRILTLDTSHLFGNQWNTVDDAHYGGFRVFNWYEAIYNNADCKSGHYLLVTQAMRDLCASTYKCNYCGTEYYGHANKGKFCSACLDSPYLTEKDLRLLRLDPIDINGHRGDIAELTAEEREKIMPIYIRHQTVAIGSRDVKEAIAKRKAVEAKYERETAEALTERDGMLWLLNRNINTDNVIYYPHSGKFCFGWRNKLDGALKSSLMGLLEGFPFEYEFK